jgi:hypothetical protein
MLASGAVSHVAAGGLLPHPVVLLLMVGGFTAMSARFLLGPASTARIVTLVVVGQGLAHTALSALAGHRGDATTALPPAPSHVVASLPVGADGDRVGSLLDAYHSATPAAAAHGGPSLPTTWVGHLVGHLSEQGPLMLAAHVAGAVALGLWLAVGERALWALLDLAAARVVVAGALLRAVRAVVVVLCRVTRVCFPARRSTGFAPNPRVGRPALTHRGPPLLLAS